MTTSDGGTCSGGGGGGSSGRYAAHDLLDVTGRRAAGRAQLPRLAAVVSWPPVPCTTEGGKWRHRAPPTGAGFVGRRAVRRRWGRGGVGGTRPMDGYRQQRRRRQRRRVWSLQSPPPFYYIIILLYMYTSFLRVFHSLRSRSHTTLVHNKLHNMYMYIKKNLLSLSLLFVLCVYTHTQTRHKIYVYII